jgi:hypothetical protein
MIDALTGCPGCQPSVVSAVRSAKRPPTSIAVGAFPLE